MYTIIISVFAFFLFNFVIMAHEWGHFITAKKFGVKVNEFAIGMGPKVLKFERGETLYSLRLLPIGGFCALEGEESPEGKDSKKGEQEVKKVDPKRSFKNKPAWQRAIIMVAGVFMNMVVGILLSILLTSMKANIYGTKIGGFAESYSVSSDGLKIGDELVSIDGYKTHVSRDVRFAAGVSNDNKCEVDVIRNGHLVHLKDVSFTVTDAEGNKSLGIYLDTIEKNFINVVSYAFADVGALIRNSVSSIVGLIGGKFSLKDVTGPVGIATQIGGIASREKSLLPAMLNITSFMMMISISLAVFNLLPFPALDGGRIIMLIPEAITGKPVNAKAEEIINTVGIVLLMLLTILITYNDIISLFKGSQ